MPERATTRVLSRLEETRPRREDLYRHLHAHPELSHQEFGTAALVAERLRESGYEVHPGIGGTGVVGILSHGDGPRVLLRADMDALPVAEATGLDHASSTVATDADGREVPVAHACGHDVHVTCLLEAADLLAGATGAWTGTVIALFQPAEELGDGARVMLADGLPELVGEVDVALGQHVLAFPAGRVATRSGPTLAAADSIRVTVHGRGSHGSMPQTAVDPVVLAAMIVLRLQTIVSREIGPTEPAVVTVGSLHAGSKSNVIGDRAVLEINTRTYSAATRERVLEAIRRIVLAECRASGSPTDPTFEVYDRFPPTVNNEGVTATVRAAFEDHFGPDAVDLPLQSASEDFREIPRALGAPSTYWGIGGTDAQEYAEAVAAGRVDQDIPANHSPEFAPVVQPTLDTGTRALVVAALAHLGRP